MWGLYNSIILYRLFPSLTPFDVLCLEDASWFIISSQYLNILTCVRGFPLLKIRNITTEIQLLVDRCSCIQKIQSA